LLIQRSCVAFLQHSVLLFNVYSQRVDVNSNEAAAVLLAREPVQRHPQLFNRLSGLLGKLDILRVCSLAMRKALENLFSHVSGRCVLF
jgi:hypothetical protein